ncbi:MAG: hypothetical protein R3Y05_01375 [bacterium]
MATIYTFLWMTSSIIGFGKIIKVMVAQKKPKNFDEDKKTERTPTEKIIRIASRNFRVSGNALNPTGLGEEIARIIINIYGRIKKVMLEKLKSVSKTQWISLAVFLLGMGFTIAIIFIPSIAKYENLLEMVIALTLGSGFVGIFKSGAAVIAPSEEEIAKENDEKERKCKQESLSQKLIKLDELYAVVLEAKANEDLKPLTAEQVAEYSTYLSTKGKLEAQIAELEVVTEQVVA